jgi:hypothetical protein
VHRETIQPCKHQLIRSKAHVSTPLQLSACYQVLSRRQSLYSAAGACGCGCCSTCSQGALAMAKLLLASCSSVKAQSILSTPVSGDQRTVPAGTASAHFRAAVTLDMPSRQSSSDNLVLHTRSTNHCHSQPSLRAAQAAVQQHKATEIHCRAVSPPCNMPEQQVQKHGATQCSDFAACTRNSKAHPYCLRVFCGFVSLQSGFARIRLGPF